MKNKFLSFVLALTVIFTSFSFTTFALEKEKELVFASLTEEQLLALKNNGIITSGLVSQVPIKPYSNKSSNLPQSYFLAKDGFKTIVGNQGKFGTCWAFSALTSSETGLMKYNQDVNFSEAHLSYFTYASKNQKKAFRNLFGDYNPFNNGGFTFTATNSLANWYGPVYEEDFPYSNEKISEKYKYNSVVHLQNMISFPKYAYENENEQKIARQTLVEQVKGEMYKNKQAVDIAYLASNQSVNYNPETNAWYNYTGDHTNHGVVIIGWDDNYPKENFNNSEHIENNGAWLVQNSWGEEWGDDGCFWLSYEDVTINYIGIYKYENRYNYENIYSHDESIQYTPIGFEDSTEIHMANVFDCSREEVLEAVSFYTTDVNTIYNVKIYTGLTDESDPTSGTLQQEIDGIKALPGYYTEVLPKAVNLNKGEKFSVVVYLENPTQVFTAQVEAIFMEYRIQSVENLSNAGESFVSIDGEDWEDIHKKVINGFDGKYYMRLGNFVIKAFTSSDLYVKFSLGEGDVSLAEKLNFSCSSADEIYYTTDGTDPITNGILYTSPVDISDMMTVKAVAFRDGVFGEVYERHFSQDDTMLSEVIVTAGEKEYEMNVNTSRPDYLVVDNECSSITVTTSSMYDIKVNGTMVSSGESVDIELTPYKQNTVEITVSDEGFTDYNYSFQVYINPITYDFEDETLSFDEDKVSVKTKHSNQVVSGQSVKEWLDSDATMAFVINMDGYNVITELPKRLKLDSPEIDFINEQSTEAYSGKVYYKLSEDGEEFSVEDDYLPVFPGETVYLYRKAEDGMFGSKVIEWQIPPRPEVNLEVKNVTKTLVSFTYNVNLEYTCSGKSLFALGAFSRLTPGETYIFNISRPANENEFASENFVFEITTKTDETFEKLKRNIALGETDNSFTAQLTALLSKAYYIIRIFVFTFFE